jgi:GNAT superfamily N-acetyltransferase
VSDIEVRAIDAQDEGELRAWWETGRAAAAERPYDVYPAWEHSRVALPEVNAERDLTLLAAYDGDAMVGIAASELPLLDNTHACWMDVGVPAERRRRGIGTALVDEVERLARKAGRTQGLGAAVTRRGGE